MALPFDPSTGAYVTGSAMGAVPSIAPIQSPNQAALDAMAEARSKKTALQQALLKAAVLRDQPLYGQGSGPLGIQIGQGPGGWAVALGSALAGVLAKKAHEGAGQDVGQAMGALSPAEQQYVQQYLQSAPGQDVPNYGKPALAYVPQGSPLSLGNQ